MKIYFLFFITLSVSAQVLNESEVTNHLEKLEKLAPEKYVNEIAPIRESLQKYLLTKKRVCQGEFTPRAITSNGDAQKINETEKKACFQELKDFEGSFIEALYACRRRYLEYNHKVQLEELQKVQEIELKDLKKKY